MLCNVTSRATRSTASSLACSCSFSSFPKQSATLRAPPQLQKADISPPPSASQTCTASAPGALVQSASKQRRSVSTSAMANNGMSQSQEVATVGGGCFWCVEAVYNQMKGVYSAVSGYAGGHVENPTYEQVCNKTTGHAEVVQVKYDPSVVDYRTVLEVFFTVHDPTTKDRQGNDVGPQYRSVIMYHNEEQKKIAEEVMKDVAEQKIYGSAPLVTELLPASKFYEAEKYHQRYYEQNPYQGYCQYVVGPKVAKFRSKWAKLLAK